MNPYERYAAALARLLEEGRGLPLGGFAGPPRPEPGPGAPRLVILSPHPDDECIVGGLALRLRREAGMRVVNVAVTQGSDPARQAGRWEELRAACGYLGFDLVATGPRGLERISTETRTADRRRWDAAVDVIAGILADQAPAVVFCPHAGDWNGTHIGTHHLAMDALSRQPSSFRCTVVETEFWGAMPAPNLMAAIEPEDLADLMAALSFHVEEVRRNPYHVLLPAWMMDNVRRGSELVAGQGAAAPGFTFATLYRVSRWENGRLAAREGGLTLHPGTSAATLLTGR